MNTSFRVELIVFKTERGLIVEECDSAEIRMTTRAIVCTESNSRRYYNS